jgi:glycerol-3-phosphate cytidylyltransferase
LEEFKEVNKMSNGKIGFLAGNFDVIHPGYIRMFKDSKTVCDYLVVGLHTDPSIERPEKLKPILTIEERKEMLLELKSVDSVMTYETEADLVTLLESLQPHVRILGSDYKGRGYTGDHLSIPIHYHARDHQWSTTDFKRKIAKSLIDR